MVLARLRWPTSIKTFATDSAGEAAFLAGIIRAPNRYSTAERRPERAAEARDRALLAMTENNVITAEQAQDAKKAPLQIVRGRTGKQQRAVFRGHGEGSPARPLLRSGSALAELSRLHDAGSRPGARRSEAVDIGMENVDRAARRRYARWRKQGQPCRRRRSPWWCSIRTPAKSRRWSAGAIMARASSTTFWPGASRARSSSHSFMPRLSTGAVGGVQPIVTPATTVVDEPTTFDFDGKEYTPNNYGEKFHGTVTLRDALTYSLNVATVKVAEMVGYGRA